MLKLKTMCRFLFVLGFADLFFTLCISKIVMAHCDTLDGPVVMEAKAALEKGDVVSLLKWVKKEYESEITAAFKKTIVVRSMGKEARELADMYFFETIVRLHRAGEGAPYAGLKPAGEVEPIVAAADKAIADGNVNNLTGEIEEAVRTSVLKRFQHLIEAKKHKDESVEAGREYVEAYVVFVHYIEALHKTIHGDVAEHH